MNRLSILSVVLLAVAGAHLASAQGCVPGSTCVGPYFGEYANTACTVDYRTTYHQILDDTGDIMVQDQCRKLTSANGARYQTFTCLNGQLAILEFRLETGCVGLPSRIQRYTTDICYSNSFGIGDTSRMYRCSGDDIGQVPFVSATAATNDIDTSETEWITLPSYSPIPAYATLYADAACHQPTGAFALLPLLTAKGQRTQLATCYNQVSTLSRSRTVIGEPVTYSCAGQYLVASSGSCDAPSQSEAVVLNKCVQIKQGTWAIYTCNQ